MVISTVLLPFPQRTMPAARTVPFPPTLILEREACAIAARLQGETTPQTTTVRRGDIVVTIIATPAN